MIHDLPRRAHLKQMGGRVVAEVGPSELEYPDGRSKADVSMVVGSVLKIPFALPLGRPLDRHADALCAEWECVVGDDEANAPQLQDRLIRNSDHREGAQ